MGRSTHANVGSLIDVSVQDEMPRAYTRSLQRACHSCPLFYPRSTATGGGQIGDCGYIEKGSFRKLFNVFVKPPSGLPTLQINPEFDILDENRLNYQIFQSSSDSVISFSTSLQTSLPAPLSVAPISVAPQISLKEKTLAFLALTGPYYKVSSLTRPKRSQLREWATVYRYALRTLYGGDLIFVSETMQTSGWVGGIFCLRGKDISAAVSVQALNTTVASANISWTSNNYTANLTRGPVAWDEDRLDYTVAISYTTARRRADISFANMLSTMKSPTAKDIVTAQDAVAPSQGRSLLNSTVSMNMTVPRGTAELDTARPVVSTRANDFVRPSQTEISSTLKSAQGLSRLPNGYVRPLIENSAKRDAFNEHPPRRSLLLPTINLEGDYVVEAGPENLDLTNRISFTQDTISTATSIVRRGNLKDGTSGTVAVKQIRNALAKDEDRASRDRRLVEHVRFLKPLAHLNILPYIGTYSLENHICLVSPWADGGNLDRFLRCNPKAERAALVVQVAAGLSFLHSTLELPIVHGDIHMGNVLIFTPLRAVISDIALNTIRPARPTDLAIDGFSRSKFTNMAPELHATRSQFTVASDVYAFAMLLFEVYAGYPPFADRTPVSAISALCRGERPQREEIKRSDFTFWGVLVDCWAHNPSYRPTMQAVYHRLSHD